MFFDRFSSSTAFSSWQPRNHERRSATNVFAFETCNTTVSHRTEKDAVLRKHL